MGGNELSPTALEYVVREEMASKGGPEAKLQLFQHVYENLPELEARIPLALAYRDNCRYRSQCYFCSNRRVKQRPSQHSIPKQSFCG